MNQTKMSLLPTKRPKIESETHGLDISPPTIHEQVYSDLHLITN